MMKNKNKYLPGWLLLLLVTAILAGCKPVTDDGPYVEPVTLYEKVNGIWNLSDLRQVDETAKAAGLSPSEVSLYAQFTFGTFSIDLKTEANTPTAYQVSGTAPELFPNAGYWQLDSAFPYADGTTPKILLYSDVAKTVKTGELSITSVPGATAAMELRLTRTSGGVPFVSYIYKLVR
ncbi:MAG: DUF5004 domain-containing protein [Dysgonamonadaceae bacterium]|jgi:hypothetical protein|nr:DUF5004 domain-containing protein [Dysgonamonadaceae bacterium]